MKPHLEDLIKEENVTSNIQRSSLLQAVKTLKISLDPNNSSPLARAYHEGMPLHITPDKIGQYNEDTFLQKFRASELVIMPLKAKDKVNGLIVADNLFTQKPITEDDLRLFMMLANQAGLAIENASLYELVRHQSHTDSITNLWNHGFFQDKLSREIGSARAHHCPLTLLILDIDDFKKLNDTCGHHNGDIVLREIANILKDSSRENDYACRYGGEEFAIILTQTTKEQGSGHRGAYPRKSGGIYLPVIRGRRRAETSRDGQCRLEHFAWGWGRANQRRTDREGRQGHVHRQIQR